MDISIKTESEQEPRFIVRTNDIVASAERAVINSCETAEKGTDLIKITKSYYKKIEDERKTLVNPLNKIVKAINARFKTFTDPLKEAEKKTKEKLLVFEQVQREKQHLEEEKHRKAEEERLLAQATQAEAEGKKEDADKILNNVISIEAVKTNMAPVRGDFGGVASIRKTWDFEVIDIQKLAQAHPDLVQVNSVAIRKKIREGQHEIAGLRIFEKDNIAVR